jgi:hypothetical protein
MMAQPLSKASSPNPPKRWLRAFAFDPIISRKIETHEINEVTIGLPWEKNLRPGPVDDYLEIVDYDPSSQAFYAPVDLNDTNLLAQDGLPASEGNPQFHQQMVYTVARNTISHFERALGRRALWSLDKDYNFVERLRVYPHAFREANAYYSPYKKALLFGYFPASTSEPGDNLPGGTVFTCLSHDIIAHETTHALLDGLHPRFIEPTNVDVWALHEAFADIVALFQHFSYPEVLRHQIDQTRGSLERQNLLGELAMQFGQAIEHYGALRSAIGKTDEKTNKWVPLEPEPEKILTTHEPHRRGAILVAAVFDAFLTIYKWRIADLLRIYTGGTGVLLAGQLHPDLVNRLAKEAAKTAKHMLNMCIRALDFCPPVDVDYGDYLRAMITADVEMVPDDRLNYRIAVIEAFRRRGIYPRDVRNLSEESLLWHKPTTEEQLAFQKVFTCPRRVRELIPDWGLTTCRKEIHDQAEECRRTLHGWFTDPLARDAAEASKIVLDENVPKSIYRGDDGIPTLEVHSVRPARRIGPDGQAVTELVVEMTQRRWGYFDTCIQKKVDRGDLEPTDQDFIFRGGCTLLVDLETAKVRYCIYKRVTSENRLNRMRRYLLGDWRSSNHATYFGDPRLTYWQKATSKRREMRQMVEPFALLHRSYETQEEIH